VGASTGGFTDCLLQRGASAVVAVDVAYGMLAWKLRSDARVHVLERTNARTLTPERLPFLPDLAVVDVSFISLAKVLPAVLGCMAERYDVLALVKPQFELGRGRVGKGGVVRRSAERRAALLDVGQSAIALGAALLVHLARRALARTAARSRRARADGARGRAVKDARAGAASVRGVGS